MALRLSFELTHYPTTLSLSRAMDSVVPMSESAEIIELPPGHAVAALDGSFGRHGASAGIVMLRAGKVHLIGTRVAAETSWEAESCAVALAIGAAREFGIDTLRLLIDNHWVAMTVQGFPIPDDAPSRRVALAEIVEEARASGMRVTARVVLGHTETMDLPSRLNDLAHILCNAALGGDVDVEADLSPGWLSRLAASDPRFRPTFTHQKWASFVDDVKAAHLLGLDTRTIHDLLKCGHLRHDPRGISRREVASIFVHAQRMRHDGFFGFSSPEHQRDCWEDEILRGWDGRASGYFLRKLAERNTAREREAEEAEPALGSLSLA